MTCRCTKYSIRVGHVSKKKLSDKLQFVAGGELSVTRVSDKLKLVAHQNGEHWK